MVGALLTCTIVLIIILATFVLGITASFVASRYCKFNSGIVFVSPEATPSPEKPSIQIHPIPTCSVQCEGPPPLQPPLQQLDRLGPSYPPQRRHPQRTLQCSSALPNLCRLPPRRPINKPCKPQWLPADVDRSIPCKRRAYGPGPPQIILCPRQPKQTKSPEGLRPPPAFESITAFLLSFTGFTAPIWCDFAVVNRIRGTPNRAPAFLLLPSLVPFILPPVFPPMPPVIVTTLIFYPTAPQSTRLEIEPHGGFRINLVPVSVRREPVRTRSPKALPTRATNSRWCLSHPAPMGPDPKPQELIVKVQYSPKESDPIPEPVTLTVTSPPPAPFIFPPPKVSICLPLPDLPLPLPPFSGWPHPSRWPQIPRDPNTPPALPVEKRRKKAKAKPKGRRGTPQRAQSTPPIARHLRHPQGGCLTSTLGGPWCKKGYNPRCASSREPTPGPGDFDPEHPAVYGRIPGRVPGHPELRRDPDIRLWREWHRMTFGYSGFREHWGWTLVQSFEPQCAVARKEVRKGLPPDSWSIICGTVRWVWSAQSETLVGCGSVLWATCL